MTRFQKDFFFFLLCFGSVFLGISFYILFNYQVIPIMIPLLMVLGALLDEKRYMRPTLFYIVPIIVLTIISLIFGEPARHFLNSFKPVF